MFRKAHPDECPKILAFARQEPVMNLFLIGDLEFYGMDPEFIEVWTESDSDDTYQTILLRYHRNFLLYSCTQDYDPREVIRLVTENGGVGFSCSARDFEPIRRQLPDGWIIHPMTMARMERLILSDRPLPQARLATPEDADDIARSLTSIVEFQVLMSETPEERAATLRRKMIEGFSTNYIIRRDGKVVANANTSAISRQAAMIGGVFTLPAYRNQGLATSVVSALCQRLLTEGRTPVLFFENPNAASIYHHLGFADLGDWIVGKLPLRDPKGSSPVQNG
ncbi:MAG TPA: GNAT family N-acetyltransferase [Bacillota bacterium]|nr:GNAT family N-acetyltransferase [Bacillota bacterium]